MTARRLGLLLGAILILALLGLRYFSDEAAIRRRLASAAESFEGERILGLASVVSRTYHDENDLDFERLLGMAHEAFRSYDDMRVSLSVDDVQVVDDTATASLAVRITGSHEGQRGNILGSLTDPARALVRLRKERGDWMLTGAEQIRLPGGRRPELP
jgi:hypothetical protein